MRNLLTALLTGVLMLPALTHAGSITFNFVGTVTQVPVDDLGSGIQPLNSITGSFTFDSTAIDAISGPTSGSYTSSGAAFGMTVVIGASAVSFSESGLLNLGILDSFVDQYTVHATSTGLVMDLFFQDNTATSFSSDALPLTPPSLAAFAQRDFHLDETDVAGNETQVDGTITSLTCGSGCVASSVPEPSCAGLLFTGATLLGGLRSARCRKSKA
jgi:hypothetical protein